MPTFASRQLTTCSTRLVELQQNCVVGQQRQQISATNSLLPHRSWCGRPDSKHRFQMVLIFRRQLCYGSKKWRWLILWTSWNPHDQWLERIFRNFEMLDAKIAWALKKIIQNAQFNKEVSLEEQKAQKEDRFLRGRQIAFLICEYFQVTGAHDAVLDYFWFILCYPPWWQHSGIRYEMGRSSVIDVKKSIRWNLGKSVQIENTWVRATQNCIEIVRHGDSWKDIGSQLSKIENHGKEKYRLETSFTKLWRQARENRDRSSGQESKGNHWCWRRKRYLLPVERKRPVFARRPLQFPPRDPRSCRAQKPEHTAATPLEPTLLTR